MGTYPSSLHLLRDTIVASGAALVVALGNVGARAIASAVRVESDNVRLVTQRSLERRGIERDVTFLMTQLEPDDAFRRRWRRAWRSPLPVMLWTTHPSAQNMSPFARRDTLFHTRMLATRAALQAAARSALGIEPPRERPLEPSDGIYALEEWRTRVAPHHARLDTLWRAHGV